MSIVPATEGKFIDGYLHISFPLLMLSNFFILFSKGLAVGFTLYPGYGTRYFLCALVILPNLFLSLVLLTATLGAKTTLALVARYPGCLVTPVFTPWIFGPEDMSFSCLHPSINKRQVITLN